MPKHLNSPAALAFLGVILLSSAFRQVQAQTPAAPYPLAAPLSQYFIPDEAAEIELARSAAPASLSGGAEILVLSHAGYTTAIKGGNGFTCLVERSWGKDTGDPEFWNPKVRAPHCMNAPAARTYLPIVLLKTKLVLAEKSNGDIGKAIKSAFAKQELPALEPNAMCYMMSSKQYLSDRDTNWHPHMMWFVAGDAVKTWGTDLPDVPGYAGNVPEDHVTVFMIAVDHWSDGTPAQP